jgi:catechol 2,3-dioxygenase-like lactoylglutathione lyase family enzyme
MQNGVAKTLGEIALRVDDLDEMQRFYQDVIGLELMQRFPTSAFFKVADGFAGHTQTVALFDRSGHAGYQGLSATQSTVDHIAFAIAIDDFEAEKQRLEAAGLQVSVTQHAWVHWRSLYVHDPEGNEVEFVCHDPSV